MSSLRDLGLSEYESQAYESLLGLGSATAKELSDESGVPMGRIYDVLGSLESAGLVRAQSASRPKQYAAVEPETAVDRLLDRRKRELETRERQLEETASELARELEAPTTPDSRFWTAALGPEDSIDLFVERLDAAEDRVALVASTSGFDLAEGQTRAIEAVGNALDRGVDVSILLSPSLVGQFDDAVLAHHRAEFADDERFEARVSDAARGNTTVVDGREVCVELPNPVAQNQAFALVNLKDASFAADVRREFDRTWGDAAPLTAGP
ncbi:TrmB family transcriptional regulator [Halospeciosus flavus]|uniref:TrmB family transcriptional regulator n=1 Tax=Halospeciosus flavus TaxID=3032283 RepID=A0ABD5Z860_9EURY|nr:TrmB family transcriptional regulator [Halospeciosus flavus]